MLSIFPSLFAYEQLGIAMVRIALATTIGYIGYRKLTGRDGSSTAATKAHGAAEAITSVLLLIGLWSQIAALAVIIDMAVGLALKLRDRAFLTNGVNYYLLLLVMAILVLFAGAGSFAFDIRL